MLGGNAKLPHIRAATAGLYAVFEDTISDLLHSWRQLELFLGEFGYGEIADLVHSQHLNRLLYGVHVATSSYKRGIGHLQGSGYRGGMLGNYRHKIL